MKPLTTPRWELYRLLAEPIRLRLLALAASEELAIGELADLLDESQPNVSRHLKPLRAAKLLAGRKQGTRVFVRLADASSQDPVVADALAAGRRLVTSEGSLDRIAEIVRAREAPSRAFFAAARPSSSSWPTELPAYLAALAPLVSERRLAVDIGTGDGGLLEVIAPVFERVIAVDREEVQLAHARDRLALRAYEHVELVRAELGDEKLRRRVEASGGADAVFAARVLHHAPRPIEALGHVAALAAPGAMVLVIDYATHQDERFRDAQADAWLGFDEDELLRLAAAANLCDARVTHIPAARCGEGIDGHLDWQILAARRSTDRT